MAASDVQALQNLINKITELKAQIAEAELAKDKLDHRMATSLVAGADPSGGMFQQMKKSFFDPATREIEKLKSELESLRQQHSGIISGGRGQLALPAPGGQATSYEDLARRRANITRESSSDLMGGILPDIPKNYLQKWNELGKVIPHATAQIREFFNQNNLATASISSVSDDDAYLKLTGHIKRATGEQENFNYTINKQTGLREYSGTIEHTSGLLEKFSKTTDATGNKVNTAMKEGFDPSTFSAWGKQAEKVQTRMSSLGFSTEHLRDVQEEASTGIRRYSFSMRDQEGIMRRATITTDKWGNILQDTQKRFRGFLSTIARNTSEVLKWTIAVQLTYKPLMKMYELVETMIDNEAKLADITIALGESYESLTDIFKIASDVAYETGSSIKGVLEGYELAFRATGGIKDSVQRANTAQQLLIDSMLLSKVSTLDQATALDTLAGGLLQIREPLDSGQQLLDKWVAVSKRANVSIKTLAESFAITSSSAEGAGLSLDELNGVIATVAENTTLSATEAGNAVRAFISGFQTDTAVRELSRFGILVKDSGQESLDFMDVMYQVRNLFDEGLISKSQLNEIAEAIGGGARRGAQVVAFLRNLERVTEVATVSSLAQGDAQEALAIKMGTVQTKATQLENAFVQLGQSLGTEGGLLSGAKIALEVFTKMVDMTTKLTDSLGTGIPVLMAYAVAMSQINKVGGLAAFGGMMGNKLLGMQALGTGGVAGTYTSEGWQAAQVGEVIGLDKTRNKILGNVATYLKTPAGIGRAMGGVGVGLQAAGSFASEDTARGYGNVAGGAMALAFSSNPLIAIAGSAIGGAFADFVFGQEVEFKDFFAGAASTDTDEANKTDLEKLSDKQQALTDSIIKEAGYWGAAFVDGIYNNWAKLPWVKGEEMTRGQAALTSLGMGGAEDQAKLDDYLGQMHKLAEQEKIMAGEITDSIPLSGKRNALIEDNKKLIDSLILKYRDLAFEERLAGEITNKQFNEINKVLGSLGTSAGGYVAAFGAEFIELSDDVGTTAEAFEALALALTHGNEADISYLLGLLTDIAKAEYDIVDGGDAVANNAIISDRQVKGARAIQLILKDIAKSSFKLPTMIEMFGLTDKEVTQVIERAKSIRDGLDESIAGAGLGEIHTESEFKNIFGEIMLRVGQHGGTKLVEGLSEANIKEAMAELGEEGKISIDEAFSLMDFTDLSTDQFNKLAAESVRLGNLAQEKTGGALDLNWKTFAAITNDSMTGPVTAELTIMQALMKELIEVNEDQVEGIYNLPSDGSFFVPFEAYAKGFGGGGGGGNMDDWIRKFEMFLDTYLSKMGTEEEDVIDYDKPFVEPDTRYQPISEVVEELKASLAKPELADPLKSAYNVQAIQSIQQPEEQGFLDKPYSTWGALGEGVEAIIGILMETISNIVGEEEIMQSGGGAGGADIVESLTGLKSLDELIVYFTSGGFHDDAMKDSADTGETFEKIIQLLQGLEIFSPYGIDGEAKGTGGLFKDSLSDLAMATQQLSETGAMSLNLEINSDTTLTMDSQVIGTAVKQFVYEEMMKREAASSGAATKTFTM